MSKYPARQMKIFFSLLKWIDQKKKSALTFQSLSSNCDKSMAYSVLRGKTFNFLWLGRSSTPIGSFHITSLKFKVESYWSFSYCNFMMYKSSWKLVFIQISFRMGSWFCDRLRLNFYAFVWRVIYMTAERAAMLVKKVIYFGEFGSLNSSCIRLNIILMFLSSPYKSP